MRAMFVKKPGKRFFDIRALRKFFAHRDHDHAEHHQFYFDHFVVKGAEVAKACAATIANLQALKQVAA